MASPGNAVWPTELVVKRAERALQIAFDDGSSFDLSAEYLRTQSPSAEVQGHSPDQKQTVAGRRHVGIIGIEPVGHYAVRLVFDDLHDTGIFSWDYLAELGRNRDRIWGAYMNALAARGLSRDP